MEEVMTLRLKSLTTAAVLSISVILAGCANKQEAGLITGAVVGAAVGSQFGGGKGRIVTTVIGTIIGAIAGKEIGKTMDTVDRLKAQQAIQNTAVSGTTSTWSNPETGNSGTVRPLGKYSRSSSGYCRDFESDIRIDNKNEIARGRACQRSDGSWDIQV